MNVAIFVLPGAHAMVFVQGAIVALIEFGYLKRTTPDPPDPTLGALVGADSPFPPPPPPRFVVPLLGPLALPGPVPGTPAPPVPQGLPPPADPGL